MHFPIGELGHSGRVKAESHVIVPSEADDGIEKHRAANDAVLPSRLLLDVTASDPSIHFIDDSRQSNTSREETPRRSRDSSMRSLQEKESEVQRSM